VSFLGTKKRPGARTLCFHDPKTAGREKLESFAESCLDFTPQIALREEHTLFLEFSASLHLFSEESLPTLVREKALRFGIPHGRIVIANEPGTALALARYTITGTTAATLVVPPDAGRLETLAPLPLEALHDLVQPFYSPEEPKELEKRAKIERVFELLKKLGLRTLEDFSRLPARQLPARFGREGAELSLHLRNPLPALWPVWAPAEKIQERFDIDAADPFAMNGCGDVAGILEALRIPMDRTCERLRARGLKTSALHLTLTPDRGDPREWAFSLPVPQSKTDSIFPLIRDRIDFEIQKNPFDSAVSSLLLKVEETAPGGGQQRDFFSKKEELSEAWDSFLGRITQRLGEDAVYRAKLKASHRPEAAWEKILRPAADITEAPHEQPQFPPRPVQILEPPLRLRVSQDGDGATWLYPEEARRAHGWKVVKKHGPERLTGEWWNGDAFLARDYYRIDTQAEVLWVYISPDQRLYLQGFF
jgi:hypothetical protein